MKSSPLLVWRSAAQKRRFAGGLARVEAILADVAGRYPGDLGAACRSTLAAGGKRVRPLLVLLCADREREFSTSVLSAAASVELLHMATLVHDDVLDAADLRRGCPTVAHELGVQTAVSAGNYLFAQAFGLLASSDDADAVDRLSDVALGLSQGELLQMSDSFRLTVTQADYVRRCELKTANLFAVACSLGALLSGATAKTVDGLGAFGRSLGLAFQVFDDILDFTGDEKETGKRIGTDLRGGTITLPLVLALEARPELGPRLKGPAVDEAAVRAIITEVRASGALEQAREYALAHIASAREELSGCPDEVDKRLLSEVAGAVVDRYS